MILFSTNKLFIRRLNLSVSLIVPIKKQGVGNSFVLAKLTTKLPSASLAVNRTPSFSLLICKKFLMDKLAGAAEAKTAPSGLFGLISNLVAIPLGLSGTTAAGNDPDQTSRRY